MRQRGRPPLERGSKSLGGLPERVEPAVEPEHPAPEVPELPALKIPAASSAETSLEALVRSALQIQAVRIEQLAKILETVVKLLEPVVTELMDTTQLLQQITGEYDEKIDKLSVITATLVKLYELAQEEQG